MGHPIQKREPSLSQKTRAKESDELVKGQRGERRSEQKGNPKVAF